MSWQLTIQTEMEDDGRWIGEAVGLPAVFVYGATEEDARRKVTSLAFHVIADKVADKAPVHTLQVAVA